MGNRIKGRPKKSSIKAALSSSAGSKRKLSRFGKRRKKHHAGLEATLIGRSKVLKMLQITIKDFRRLCILKGIYPREPLGKVPGNKRKQFYYHIKDIRAIAHEPILEQFRAFRAFMKKIRRAAGRQEPDEAARKNSILPEYSLHHLVKERYPRFVDALADLDDALTLVYLFATLPSERNLKPKYISSAKRLAAAWGAYCATNNVITKSFISVKGVYMEACIHNTDIRWIIPHAFTQYMPADVDFRVMNTFFEFYETLLNFVLYKLYNDVDIRYPFSIQDYRKPVVGNTSSLLSANLRALFNSVNQPPLIQDATKTPAPSTKSASNKASKELVRKVDAALNQLNSDDNDDEEVDDDDDCVELAGPLKDALHSTAEEDKLFGDRKLDDEAAKRQCLFQGLTFYLSREIPRGYIELVCLAYGGKVGWEGDDSPIAVKDPSITHHIVDRPQLPKSFENLPKSREYIQPQWILDCANFRFLLPISKYAVGATLPPHLSPWVDDEEEGYKPKYAKEIEKLKNGEPLDASEDEEEEVPTEAFVGSIDGPPKEEPSQSSSEEEKEEESEDETVKSKRDHKRKKDEQEAHDLAKTMMSRKATHLYGRMQHGIAKKQAKVEKLHQRRKDLDVQEREVLKGKERDESGKTALKQKVERLRRERKKVEKTYADTGGTMKKTKKSRKS